MDSILHHLLWIDDCYSITTYSPIKYITHVEYYYNNHLSYQLLIYTKSARIEEISIHLVIFTQILVIDLDSTYWNDLLYQEEPRSMTVCRLGISIQYSIIQYQTRKSYDMRIKETTFNRSDGC